MAQVAESIDGLQYVCHSTHAGRGHYRLVIALSRPVLAAEWSRFWGAAVGALDLPADPKARDPSRLYYWPSCSATGPEPLAEEGHGAPLDVDKILSSAGAQASRAPDPPPELSPGPGGASVSSGVLPSTFAGLRGESRRLVERCQRLEPLAAQGERDDTVNRIMSVLANCGMAQDAALSFVATSLERMPLEPEGLEYWRAKAAGSFTRAAERRAKRDAQEASDRAQLLGLLGRTPRIVVEGSNEEWRAGLLYRKDKDGNPVGLQENEANLELILRHDPAWVGAVRFNVVSKSIEASGPLEGVPPADQEFATAVWFQRSPYRLTMQRWAYGAALLRVGRMSPVDPLADYLNGLQWDGVTRAGTFLQEYLRAEDTPALRLVGRKWLVSAAARGLQPGCKVDTTLILQGDYGTRKTTFVEAMAGPFYSNAKIDFTSNDSRQAAARYWLIEMAELAGLRAATREAVKDWLSTRVDSFRPPYGRVLEDFPRRAVFVGTTNDEDFLAEPNRREWVVRVGQIDIEGLVFVRDQLWAEAVAIYRAGETCPACAESIGQRCDEHSWWLVGSAAEAVRETAREFAAPNPWKDMVLDWFLRQAPEKRPTEVTAPQLAQDALGFTRDRITTAILQGLGHAVKQAGFTKRRVRRAGQLAWVYLTPAPLLAAPQGERMRPASMEIISGQLTAPG
jgi:hypothetical protein